jgi:hypothetical protein
VELKEAHMSHVVPKNTIKKKKKLTYFRIGSESFGKSLYRDWMVLLKSKYYSMSWKSIRL